MKFTLCLFLLLGSTAWLLLSLLQHQLWWEVFSKQVGLPACSKSDLILAQSNLLFLCQSQKHKETDKNLLKILFCKMLITMSNGLAVQIPICKSHAHYTQVIVTSLSIKSIKGINEEVNRVFNTFLYWSSSGVKSQNSDSVAKQFCLWTWVIKILNLTCNTQVIIELGLSWT